MKNMRVQPGDCYIFRLSDVICPDQRDIRVQITSDLLVVGEAVFLSDSGHDKDQFAVIEVKGVGTPLIVPLDRLRTAGSVVSESDAGQARETVVGG